MSGAIPHKEREKGRVETTKVKRYRPGQIPEWMKEEDDGLEIRQKSVSRNEFTGRDLFDRDRPQPLRRTAVAAPVVVKKSEDPRLARLAALEPQQEGRYHRQETRRRPSRWESRDGDGHVSDRWETQEEVGDDEREQSEGDGGAAEYVHRKLEVPQIVSVRLEVPEEVSEDHVGAEQGRESAAVASDDEEAIAVRRAAMKARLLEREKESQRIEQQKREEGGEETPGSSEEEEDSSEYDDESSEEDLSYRPLAKPVFVPKGVRETVGEREAREAEEQAELEREKERLEQHRTETKEIVAQRMAEEAAQEATQAAGPKGVDDIVTDEEEVDEEAEYQAWRLRELARLAREKEEREAHIREEQERARWKSLTEEERVAELAARGDDVDGKKKREKTIKKWSFLQKYYHRGAFFQTEADYKGESAPLADIAVSRDFSVPTGDDRVDKSTLPKVMQVGGRHMIYDALRLSLFSLFGCVGLCMVVWREVQQTFNSRRILQPTCVPFFLVLIFVRSLQVKNFGRKGRSKWTHLAAEDTTKLAEPTKDLDIYPHSQHHRSRGREQEKDEDEVFTRPTKTKT